MTLPMANPLPIMNTANHKNVFRMVLLRAPKAFNSPIIDVRSSIIINNPDIMVKPATHNINARIIHTLRSSKSSQVNICGLSRCTVSDEYCTPYLSTVLFTFETNLSATSSKRLKSDTVTSAPLTCSASQPFKRTVVYRSAKHNDLSNCERFVW